MDKLIKKSYLFSEFLLLITSIIWGFAFVAQKFGMLFIGPFLFNGIRFLIGAIIILIFDIFYSGIFKKQSKQFTENLNLNKSYKINYRLKLINKDVINKNSADEIYNINNFKRFINLFYLTLVKFFSNKIIVLKDYLIISIAGIILFTAATFQQFGIKFTTAGKSGFITSLYVVIVPIFSRFSGKKIKNNLWISSFLAVGGLFFISFKGFDRLNYGDLLVFISAIFWALHVMYIDKISKRFSPFKIAFYQYLITSILNLIFAIVFEEINYLLIKKCFVSILYGGLFSVGIGYTLQVFAQKNAHPVHASIILSLESFFAVIGGIIFLSEIITFQEVIGFILMFISIILSQMNISNKY